ncbi:MAG: phosphoadenosine phosphosulfate reductase family protein [Comamonas sp.]
MKALFDSSQLAMVWRLGASEKEHAQALADLLALSDGATVVHLGHAGECLAQLLPQFSWCDGEGLEPGQADAVVMVYAMCVDPIEQLSRARRLLAMGGTLVLQELYVDGVSGQTAARQLLGIELHDRQAVELWAELEGFSLWMVLDELCRAPGVRLDAAMPVLAQLGHGTSVWRKTSERGQLDGRSALHFSGGKDSMACLQLLQPYVQRGMPVYWMATGDSLPETLEVIRWVSERIPVMHVVRSDVKAWRAANGAPVDMLPSGCTPIGLMHGLGEMALSGRFDCCWQNLMRPMHERMLQDGIALVVRGTKAQDTPKQPDLSEPGLPYEVLLPLDGWSHGQVFDYLSRWSLFKNTLYEVPGMQSAPECVGCTAWWDDGKARYFKARNPEQLERYSVSLKSVRQELQRCMDQLEAEIKECES